MYLAQIHRLAGADEDFEFDTVAEAVAFADEAAKDSNVRLAQVVDAESFRILHEAS